MEAQAMRYFGNAKDRMNVHPTPGITFTRPLMVRKMVPMYDWETQDRHIDGAKFAEAMDSAVQWAQRREFAGRDFIESVGEFVENHPHNWIK